MLIITAGGIAVLTALGTGAYFGALYATNNSQQAAKRADSASNAKQHYPNQIDRDRAGLPNIVERIASAPDPQSTDEKEKRDLAAQEASALWSFWMLVATGFSAIITMIGTGFLLWQIMLTREAVEDTGRATDAMRDANEIAKEIGQAQVRAYVNVASVTVSITKSMLWIYVTFKNTGQSPASDVSAGFTPVIWLGSIGSPKIIEKVQDFSATEMSVDGGVIGSGDESNPIATVWSFSADDHPNFSLAEEFGDTDRLLVSVLLSFHLTWLDVFDKVQSLYGVVNAGDFERNEIAGQSAITAVGKPRNEDFDVRKWVDRKKRKAGK